MGVALAVERSQPRFEMNANMGGDIGAETRLVPALQTIFHEGRTFAGMTGRGDDGGGVDQEARPYVDGDGFPHPREKRRGMGPRIREDKGGRAGVTRPALAGIGKTDADYGRLNIRDE